MAKRRSKRDLHRSERRVAVDNANDFFSLPPRAVFTRSGRDLRRVEDRRTFYPSRIRPVRMLQRRQARITLAAVPKRAARHLARGRRLKAPTGLFFSHPRSVLVCVRRKVRREVILASGKGGRRRRRRARFNENSFVRC